MKDLQSFITEKEKDRPLRKDEGADDPAWLAKAEALQQNRVLSLFEVALVFDQLVRSAA